MKYLGNHTNAVRDAAVAATNIVPSDAVYRTDTAPKVGGGSAALSGSYSGQSNTVIEVKVVDTTGDTVSVSQPAFTGIGNGALTGAAATGLAAQTFRVTLEDLGTQTRTAYAPFQGVTLRARASGSAGNLITVEVDHSALVESATDYALQEDLRQDSNEYVGEQWNFGAATLEADGTVPATAPRLRFGGDPQVYRAYRSYQAGRYVYGFSPAPVRNVQAGSRVYLVTGTVGVTISDGTTPETLTGISTFFDALAAIRDSSTLVLVDGPVVNDRLPGGMGATELAVWTGSYVVGVTVDGGDAIRFAELDVTASAAAPTETLNVRCVSAPATGNELWEVRGDVSGRLDDAVTAVPYADGPYDFTIPLPSIPGGMVDGEVTGDISVRFVPDSSYGGNASTASLCVIAPVLGAAARNGVWRFVWEQRPPDACDCTTGELSGGPDDDCLGVQTTGGGVMSAQRVAVRMQRLAAKVREFCDSNTSSDPTLGNTTDALDIQFVQRTAGILRDCLTKLPGGTTAFDPWAAALAHDEDDVVEPTTANEYKYVATTSGTTGATEPVWPTTVGTTVVDGGVTWECLVKTPFDLWDDLLAQWWTEVSVLAGIGAGGGSGSYDYDVPYLWELVSAVDMIPNAFLGLTEGGYTTTPIYTLVIVPSVRNGHYYQLIGYNGSSGNYDNPQPFAATEPTWPTTGGVVTDSAQMVWRDIGTYWEPSTAVAVGDKAINFARSAEVIADASVIEYTCTTAGTTDATEPVWTDQSGEVITDGTAVWTSAVSAGTEILPRKQPGEFYYTRWQSIANEVLTAAGIAPVNFDDASTEGDGCWQDHNDNPGWFVYQGDEAYLPIQEGHYYHSSKLSHGENGEELALSTREFGFGPKFGCPDRLRDGDSIIITISGVAGSTTGNGYQPGDAFDVRVNHAVPLEFGGGQTGDDTLTWAVRGSVSGALADYALVTTAPAAYSDGGLGFSISTGGIAFALGDEFTFDLEGGHFQWRRDGGSWSADIDMVTTVLADGLSATFIGGKAPSWAVGDAWTFAAEAVNGPDRLRQPTDGRCMWTGSTVIEVTPAVSETVTGVLLGDHTIPSDATITLLGSDDGFATTPLSQVITWHAGHVFAEVTASTYAAYRLSVDRGGSIGWLHLGDATELVIMGGRAELGKLTKRWRLPGLSTRAALGVTVSHEAITQAAADGLLAELNHACLYDWRRLAVVPNPSEAEVAMVEYADGSLELSDLFHYQPRDGSHRFIGLTLTLDAMP